MRPMVMRSVRIAVGRQPSVAIPPTDILAVPCLNFRILVSTVPMRVPPHSAMPSWN
jgi:hypothetical protein